MRRRNKLIISGFFVLNPLLSDLAILCKLRFELTLYTHALLILTYTSKSKDQVVHEQKFKDPLSSTCQVSIERIVLDLESGVNQRPGFYSHWGKGNIFLSFITLIYIILPDPTDEGSRRKICLCGAKHLNHLPPPLPTQHTTLTQIHDTLVANSNPPYYHETILCHINGLF